MTAAKKKRDAADHLREEGAARFRERVDQDIHSQRHNRNTAAPPPVRFQLARFNEVELMTRPRYLIKNILPSTGLAVVWGSPKCGKSFWTFDLVMHIALGWVYRGHRVQQGTVVYLAMEGGTGFAGRIEAWRRRHLQDQPENDVPFYLINVALDLVQDYAAVIAAIRQQLGSQQRPATIVLDTLNRSMRGDENSSADMAEYIRAADTLRAAFDCLVVIIHHCGTAGNRPRGHTSLSGADDVQIAIERDKEGNIVATVEHAKDSEAGAVIVSRLERVELGDDDEGDPMTSCVIVEAVSAQGPKLKSQVQRFAFELLERLMTTNTVEPPADANLPKGSRVVLAQTWREEFMVGYPTGNRDSRKRMFNRGVLELDEQKLVVLWREFAWPGTAGTH
jgi:AAA domain